MGAIYMILTISVMVPMVFLTESIYKSLSSQLQQNNLDINNSIFERAWIHKNGQYRKAFLDPTRFNCNLLSRIGLPDTTLEVREVLEGEQAISPNLPLPKYRYFVSFRPDPSSDINSGYILRVSGSSGTQSEMLPWPLTSERCTSLSQDGQEFLPPQMISGLTYCRVTDVAEVLVKSQSIRRSHPWKWTWSESFSGPDDHPCICTPKDDCYVGLS